MARERHQRKQVEADLRFAEEEGCQIDALHSGHMWSKVIAPSGQRFRVWSTPQELKRIRQRLAALSGPERLHADEAERHTHDSDVVAVAAHSSGE